MTRPSSVSPDSPDSGWGIFPGCRVWIGGHNAEGKRVAEELLQDASRPPEGPIDLAIVVPKSTDEAVYFIGKLRQRLLPTSKVWVVIPKPSSPVQAELDGSAEELTAAINRMGLAEIGVVEFPDDHTSVGFSSPLKFAALCRPGCSCCARGVIGGR